MKQETKIYLVYNKKTGDIVHMHSEDAEAQTPAEEILRLVDPSLDRGTLEILAQDALPESESCRINVQSKKVEEVAATEAPNFGGIGQEDDLDEGDELPAGVKTVYEAAPSRRTGAD